jgi:hypothetical protein
MSQITVTDATTNQPIAGALVFISATPAVSSVQTDATGTAQVDTSGTILAVQVTAPGHDPWTASSFSAAVALAATVAATYIFTFNVEPTSDQTNPNAGAPTEGATITLNDSTGKLLETLTVEGDGAVETIGEYPYGSYSISISLDGYTSIVNQATTVDEGSDLTFTLTKTTSAAALSNPAAVAATTPAAGTVPPNVPPPNQDTQYEYIYPNSADGTYFQAAQARMYIGNLFIDELVTCQFQLMQNRIPIYGYRSRKFDAVGTGHSLVQGQIAINFVTEGYLYVALKEHDRLLAAAAPAPSAMPTYIKTGIDALIQQYQQAQTPSAQAPIVEALMGIASQDSTGTIISYIADAMNPMTTQSNGINACDLEIPFNIKVQLEGGGRTVTRTIHDCVLGANDFAYSHDGKTILDTYSFIGRELI